MSGRPSVLFVNQHYWPDVAATAQVLADLAEYLAGDGFDVGVLCSRGSYAGGGMRAPAREERNRVRIARIAATSFGRRSHAGRFVDYATFLSGAALRIGVSRRSDLVVFLTTPSLVGVVGTLLSGLRGQRYAMWSMDVHPDVEEVLGILPRGGMSRVFRALGDASYRRAEFVVALGERMRERLAEKGVPESRLHVIPVWSRSDQVEPVPRGENPLRAELGVDGKFVVMYSGNAGLAHRFEEVLEAIERLGPESGIEFVFAGGGPRRDEILRRVGGLPNFRYLDYWPREKLRCALSVGDVHLVTLHQDLAGLVVPVKLYGIMAAGRPAVMVGPRESDSARTIETEGAGAVIDPEVEGRRATDRLVEVLEELRDRPDERERMGRAARAAFLARYDREIACRAWADLLREALSGGA